GFCFFFFSSRRRHTRWPRDWSSDVCSSDLLLLDPDALEQLERPRFRFGARNLAEATRRERQVVDHLQVREEVELLEDDPDLLARSEERRVGKECRCRWAAYR